MRLWRALLLGLLLVPANAYWVIQMERVRAGPYVSSISLFANAVFLLTLFTAVNRLVQRRFPRWAFTPGELMLVYSMVCLATAVSGMDFVQTLVMILGHAKQFATPENGWEQFFAYLPRWLVVNNADALKNFHSGHSSLWLPQNYRPYLVPGTAWMLFTAALLLTMQGLNALLARPWIERERLTFPVLDLPLSLVREPTSFFRQPVFLAGLAIPMLWCGLNGLHFIYPAVPQFDYRQFDLVQGSSSKAIRAMGWMPVTFYPFAIGLGYLLPTDLLFSAWFFYFFWKCEMALVSLLAWDTNSQMPYAPQQSFGACVALIAYMVYLSRGTLSDLWLGLRRQGPKASLAAEYRGAVTAVVAGAAFLIAFSRLAGMSWGILLAFWATYLIIAVAVTRMRAELGPPVHDFHRMGPELLIVPSLGSQNLGGHDLGMLTLYWWINRAYRSLPMTHQIESLKAAWETDVRPGWFHVGTFLGGWIGAIAALVSYLYLGFKLGAASGFHSGYGYGWENYGRLMVWLSHPTRPDHTATAAIGTGLVFSGFLLAMRLRFLGWPFHPIGFAIAGSWSINLVWLPLLIAWVAKVSIIRAGGLKLYVRLRPFFLGLILGDCLMGSFWALVGVVFDIPTYSFWGA